MENRRKKGRERHVLEASVETSRATSIPGTGEGGSLSQEGLIHTKLRITITGRYRRETLLAVLELRGKKEKEKKGKEKVVPPSVGQ
jgi:hypothetical protein